MKSNLFFYIIFLPFIGFSQYSIDDHFIELNDVYTVSDFYANTFFNAEEEVSVEWLIVRDSMPSEWEFSNCFPSCYPPGVLFGTGDFVEGSQQYLNCHFYPNNVAGEGIVQMQITVNSSIVDTVTWRGNASEVSSISQWHSTSNPVISIYNLFGQKIEKTEPNQVYIMQYHDGTIRKSLYIR